MGWVGVGLSRVGLGCFVLALFNFTHDVRLVGLVWFRLGLVSILYDMVWYSMVWYGIV